MTVETEDADVDMTPTWMRKGDAPAVGSFDWHDARLGGTARQERRSGHGAKYVWPGGLGERRQEDLIYGGELLGRPEDVPTVVVCEGAKAASAVMAAGIPAVGLVSASTVPSESVIELLTGRQIVCWSDNDAPGRSIMGKTGTLLEQGGVASLHFVHWEAAPAHGDAADAAPDLIRQLVDEALGRVYLRPATARIDFASEPGGDDLELDLQAPEAPAAASWPDPPGDTAFHGVAGDLVNAVKDTTEADPVAMLGSILAVFGALAGRHRTFYQGAPQAANIFVTLVGDSSVGRKGTAHSQTRHIFTAAYPDWESISVPGVGSGEGLIGHLTRNAAKESKEHRALVLETEFGRLLGVMARDGSTLSPTLRDAWDGVPLGRFLAREESLVLLHHVGCLAHVTPSELRDKLTSTDAANGFGNRFLWLAVRRTQLVPFPTSPASLVAPYLDALHRAIVEAQAPGELRFTRDAAARWEAFYIALASKVSYGLVGALTARAEAQVARLALVYALLDRSAVVDVDHLAAAEALWDFAARSATFIFGDSTGNPLADFIRRHLQSGRASREELRQETGVRDATRLSAAIDHLVGLGLATVTKAPSKGRGRRPDIVELAAFPAIPPMVPARVHAQRTGRPPVGNAGNGVGAFLQGPPQEMQELQEMGGASVSEEMATTFTPVDEPEDVDDPVDRQVVEALFADFDRESSWVN